MHTLFYLEHNRIAGELQKQEIFKNYLERLSSEPAKDQVVFQETRRLLGATFQAITYREYLPLVVGEEAMQKYQLTTEPQTTSSYNASLNPTIANEFATFAYR